MTATDAIGLYTDYQNRFVSHRLEGLEQQITLIQPHGKRRGFGNADYLFIAHPHQW